jgi:hypothetical protein
MRTLLLGTNRETGEKVRIPRSAFETHFHLIGGTGKGKTTALHTILHQLMNDPIDESAFFIIDRLGNFSFELLMWIASDFCTSDVRERLIYIEPANENVVLGFNPLIYETPGHGYFKVTRATDIILRAWEDVNIEAMPRLARWTFNSFWAAAQLGLTISDCVHFLLPGSQYHAPLLKCLPDQLQAEWSELLNSRSSEVLRMLDSTRNRLQPYFTSPILNRMFGATANRLDVERFMREKKIVILNLAQKNRLSVQLGDAIGALLLNEILAVARSLPRGRQYPTHVVLDEFQNFVGPDIEMAIPEVRQLGLRLMLSHQSFSQLKRGDHDLTNMIFQAQSRLVFGLQGEDADILAHECASLKYDPKRVKEEIYSRRQLVAGHELRDVLTISDAAGQAKQWSETYGKSWSDRKSESKRENDIWKTEGTGTDRSENKGGSEGKSDSFTHTESRGQTYLPVYEQFAELASRTYYTFEEQRNLWGQKIRQLSRGRALLRLVDDPQLYDVDIKRMAAGYLKWPLHRIAEELPEVLDEVDRLIEENFASDLFTTPEVIERETQDRLQAVLSPRIVLQSQSEPKQAPPPADPFR